MSVFFCTSNFVTVLLINHSTIPKTVIIIDYTEDIFIIMVTVENKKCKKKVNDES